MMSCVKIIHVDIMSRTKYIQAQQYMDEQTNATMIPENKGNVNKVKAKKTAVIATKEIAYIALSVALLCVCSWISLPIGEVPFTLQTFAVTLIAVMLGWKRAVPAVVIYVLLGIAGVPVLQGFKAGIPALMGATGGYVFGFVLMAFFTGIAKAIKAQGKARSLVIFLSSLLGLIACYAFGTIWFVNVYTAKAGQSITYASALMLCVVPYIVPDIVKLIIAIAIGLRLEKTIK